MGNKAVAKHETLPHVEWIDLNDNKVAIEVIVVKRDKRNGDLYFIKTEELDEIDRNRLVSILRKRDAARYELWDLLDNTTLGNGENALEFFHQLVKVKTEGGAILIPGAGRSGISLRPDAKTVSIEEADDVVAPAKRGPGRPPKT
jgi:hypothetical protein